MTDSRAENVEKTVSASVAEGTTSVGGRHTEALEQKDRNNKRNGRLTRWFST